MTDLIEARTLTYRAAAKMHGKSLEIYQKLFEIHRDISVIVNSLT